MKKKIYSNVKGLGYEQNNIENLKNNINNQGGHHVKNQIDILEGKFHINTNYKPHSKTIYLSVFNNYLKNLKRLNP